MTTRGPGIIYRLGNLIIVQVLFIFVALALILFVPEPDQELDRRLATMERELVQAGRSAARSIAAHQDSCADDLSLPERLATHLDNFQQVDHAAVIRVGEGLRLEIQYALERPAASEAAIADDQDISSYCSYEMLQLMAASAPDMPPQAMMYADHIVYYHRLHDDDSGRPLVLVLARKHALTVSSQPNLQYAVLILFLCSALVSLLTVSLLLRKFKRPLDRIIAGFDETADGKLHSLAEFESDPHLGRLTRAYNVMTQKLWETRRELDDYFKRLEKANTDLRESRSFLMTLFDSTPLSVVVTDPVGTIIMFNQTAAAVFGFDAEEVAGRPLAILLDEEPGRLISEGPAEGQSSFEVICRRQDGTVFPAYVLCSTIETEPDGVVARLYVCRDITDSKDFQEMMIRLDRYYTRGEMAGDIAHEINNYLAVLLGNVELLPLLLKKGKMDKVEKKLDVMKTALENIARFSDGLLDSGPDIVRLEPASVNQIVENVIAFLKPQNKFDVVDIVKSLSTEIPVLRADQAQIQQLLVNLIYNAAEAVAQNDEQKTVQVITAPAEVDGTRGVRITVRDNGPGVVPDKEELLFKTRFTTKKRGHGIGLVTCRKIVDNHAGDITYEAQNGAVFSAFLPVVEAAAVPGETLRNEAGQPV